MKGQRDWVRGRSAAGMPANPTWSVSGWGLITVVVRAVDAEAAEDRGAAELERLFSEAGGAFDGRIESVDLDTWERG